MKDLKELRIFETLDDIKVMSEQQYVTILNNRTRENALKYLKDKQRSKGKNIHYEEIQMAEYLLPINTKLSIEQKQKMFALKNRMVELPENFPGRKMDDKCFCNKPKTTLHIYQCENLNDGNAPQLDYEFIHNGNLKKQVRIFEKFDENLKKCEQRIKERNGTPCDPVEIRYLYSNG